MSLAVNIPSKLFQDEPVDLEINLPKQKVQLLTVSVCTHTSTNTLHFFKFFLTKQVKFILPSVPLPIANHLDFYLSFWPIFFLFSIYKNKTKQKQLFLSPVITTLPTFPFLSAGSFFLSSSWTTEILKSELWVIYNWSFKVSILKLDMNRSNRSFISL